MKDKLIFATGNPNKVRETEDIPETMPTLEGCALQKARYLATNYQVNCFSEDTGLEVDALDGAPGVITARYAGEDKNAMLMPIWLCY